jgi:hypothetical protein
MVVWFNKATSAFLCLETKKSSKRKFKTNRSSLAQGYVHPGDSPTGPMREGELVALEKLWLDHILLNAGFSRQSKTPPHRGLSPNKQHLW